MPNPKSITGKARAVFSDTARRRLQACDEPMLVVDAVTGCTLTYRFEETDGRLRVTDGCLGRKVVSIGCDPDQLNFVATLLLDGLRSRGLPMLDEPSDAQLDPSPWSPQ